MSQSKLLVYVLAIGLLVIGWGGTIMSLTNDEAKEYDKYLAQAKDYESRDLYQKAIEQYDAAIAIKDSVKIRKKELSAYEARYKEDEGEYSEYLAAAVSASQAFPSNEDFVLKSIELYVEDENEEDAYDFVNKAIENGCDTDAVEAKKTELRYSYAEKDHTYDSFAGFNTYYAVESIGVYSYVKYDGTEVSGKKKLNYAGLCGQDGTLVFEDDNGVQIVDSNGVVQGWLKDTPVDTGYYSEGIIAVKYDDSWSYYDVASDEYFGEYDEAGSFIDGKAAVCKDGKWYIVGTDGKKVSDTVYGDIKLSQFDEYIKDGIMIAELDGKYHFYDSEGNQIGDFSAEDVDIVSDGDLIAFSKDGKWGFADKKGNIIIKPAYSAAKSFSNGLAAVSDGSKWGFIDENNKLVIDYNFYDADYFNESGSCMIKDTNQTWKLIIRNINE